MQRAKAANARSVILTFGGPASQVQTTGGAFWLDSFGPTIDQDGIVQIEPNAGQTLLLPTRSDPPGISLVDSLVSTWYSVTANEQFDDYLMFQSDTPDSIWVTLRKITWQWGATATNANPWTVTPPSTSSATLSVPSSDLPQWDHRIQQDIRWE